MVSNVEYKSNIYPVNGDCRRDREFLSQIHDVFALKKLSDLYAEGKLLRLDLTELQRAEYLTAAGHCRYAAAGDYPWGTIIDGDGQSRVVCKCDNFDCHRLHKCRPDLSAQSKQSTQSQSKPSTQSQLQSKPSRSETAPQSARSQIELPQSRTSLKPHAPSKHSKRLTAVEVPSIPTPSKPAPTLDVQEQIIAAKPDERIIVDGAPGTGKTHTLIEKIIHMVDEQGVAADKILVFCFTRAAVDVIRNRLSAASEYLARAVDVRTFDSFATYILAAVNRNFETQTYDERIDQALALLKQQPDGLDHYAGGHVIIDEVQDLVGARAKFVIQLLDILPMSCGFTLLGDPCQALYDYLTGESVISSEQFYSSVNRLFPTTKHFSLTDNHRQNNYIKWIANDYRALISEGDAAKLKSGLDEVRLMLTDKCVNLREFSPSNADKYRGTLGILTRTNAQALTVSSWLHNNDVAHTLRRGSRNATLDGWIANVFCEYPNETINESDFIERHREIYPDIDETVAIKRWAALVEPLKVRNRYEIEDILRALNNNPAATKMFDNDNVGAITVSTVHRVKGREFDSVILLDDLFKAGDAIFEHKIFYVGLTRAKTQLERASMKTQYVHITKNENRRCFLRSRKYLSKFEIGIDGDVDARSFGLRAEVQDCIRRDLEIGMSVKLQKCAEGSQNYVTYKIVVEEPIYIELGNTGKVFAVELEQALRRIFDLPNDADVFYDHYPNEFHNVFVDGFTTHVSMNDDDLPAARRFGDVQIWSGVSLIGFADVGNGRF